MNKKEVTEIKRRFKKEGCSFTRIAGCYVDANKEKVLTFNETFLNLEEEEMHKYLELASKCLSGTMGNNLLELPFSTDAELEGGGQDLLMQLRASKLKDEKLLMTYYDRIVDTYDFIGNYLIFLLHDVYDIPMKTTDGMMLDDSEEVYEYVVGAICPVILSKPGLGYRADENRIGSRERDWVVGATDTGFVFPCFSERSSDIHSVMAYTKNAKDPHTEFWTNGLGSGVRRTSTQKKNAFANMVNQTIGEETEDSKDTVVEIQSNLQDFIINEQERLGEEEPVVLMASDVNDILLDSGVSDGKAEKISKNYEDFFGTALPLADELLDTKVLKNNEIRLEKKVLQERVVDLTHQLSDAGVITKEGHDADIYIKLPEEKAVEIKSQIVDGRKCILVPLEDEDIAIVNGTEFNA